MLHLMLMENKGCMWAGTGIYHSTPIQQNGGSLNGGQHGLSRATAGVSRAAEVQPPLCLVKWFIWCWLVRLTNYLKLNENLGSLQVKRLHETGSWIRKQGPGSWCAHPHWQIGYWTSSWSADRMQQLRSVSPKRGSYPSIWALKELWNC